MKYYYFFIAISLFYGIASFDEVVEVDLPTGKPCLIVDAFMPVDNKLESGQEVTIRILGVDRTFYTYMNLMIEQSEGSQGPFQSPTVKVKGNVFDLTDLDNQEFFNNVEQADIFPLGDFAIVQEFKNTVTFSKLI